MKISGFTFLYNAITNEYPFKESILSLLPLVDEYIIVLVESEDETERELKEILFPNIRIIKVQKPEFFNKEFFSKNTQIGYRNCTGDFCFYLQADEVLHERFIPYIRKALNFFKDKKWVKGFVLKYKHFYGSYNYYHSGFGWYKKEIRILRKEDDIYSFGDAKSFRRGKKKLRIPSIELDAEIYHYGWVKNPWTMQRKREKFEKILKGKEMKWEEFYPFKNVSGLKKFTGTHPYVMRDRIKNFHEIKMSPKKPSLKKRVQEFIADFSERYFKRRFLEAYHFVSFGKFKLNE